jgi:predicted permease
MGSFLNDLRHGVRMLGKHPGLASIAIVALALGLGLVTTMWSINYGGLLRGLPFEEADRLIFLLRSRPSHGITHFGVSASDFAAWREQQRSFEDLAAYTEGTINVAGPEGPPERFEGGFITAATFRLLRVSPVAGRLFAEEDDRAGATPVAIIAYDLWHNRFGGDPAIIGKTLRANGVVREIVGVMPRGFLFPTNSHIWLPRTVDPLALPWGSGEELAVMGRLKPGVSLAQATREFEAISARLAQDHVKENEGVAPILKPFTEQYIGDDPVIMLWTMMAAVFGVLLIACSNVANLLLARAATRTREVAVRAALGASRWRIASQLLAESLVLSAIGAVLGIGIAWVGTRLFMDVMRDVEAPFWIDIKVDGPVLAFVLGATLLAALVSGIVPALQATRGDLQSVLKDEGRGTSSMRLGRFSRALVIAELALSGGLLVGAGFMIQSVVQRSRFDYGVRTEGVFTARVGLFPANHPDSASRARFWSELEQRLQQLPGQEGAALMSTLPGMRAFRDHFGIEGQSYAQERDYPETRRVGVTPGWFTTFGVRPLEGRLLAPGDNGGSLPVAVVTQGFARKYLGHGPAVGKRIRLGGKDSQAPWLTIVGVAPDVWYDGTGVDDALRAVVFLPLAQGDYQFLSLAVATRGDPMALTRPVLAQLTAIDPDQPMYWVRSLVQAVRRDGWFYTVFGALFMVFGGAALLLATIGVYGVVSFGVSRRTQEIGVRMALGASSRDVMRLFLRQGARQLAVGLGLSLALAYLLSRGLTSALFQVDTGNPLMYAGVTGALGLTTLFATYLPARRALAVDPLVALRYE